MGRKAFTCRVSEEAMDGGNDGGGGDGDYRRIMISIAGGHENKYCGEV